MPKVDVYNMDGQKVGDMILSDDIFGVEINTVAMHAAVVNILANARQGTQSTKTRAEVRGGGRKPWRQKGTGRARHGSIRSPQWVGGGIALGPKPRSYKYTLPKKVRRLALKSALSSKVLENDIVVLDDLKLDEIKTKQMVKVLNNLKVDSSALIVLPAVDEKVIKSSRNICGVKTALVNTINTYDILKYKKFIATREAIAKIEEVYA
ncbi:MAG TPA: 50S ribosomal protein L4 [Thermoclostridium caenicola]|uniref:Large ribosomal subunit protein uL4 n=1 Tax=Thermoclostridium caenicola TaxID=659425 RepID=A0A1M6F7S4_9FIRM|nr:50S ribosomal protein L4 [Thermoclostridium caenicola]SHI93757.1 LSU ribosomal protein L4P [Thermoclostridium caenicola]HOK42158.1 50S ribosomal protein L4 [Thermoclostridium caenicola]HOL83959.1 50S ribosomal protein L4 [Thermoclostridium caenicola]HOP72075.1 50S ribosomal protein L4 [Thermoclostridium caenicola]HPO75554.1 50S ribosomal protein L4 [Thermoclostridium caenicola]